MKQTPKFDALLLPLAGFLIAILISLLYLSQPQLLRQLDHKIYDSQLAANHTRETTKTPIIIDIDEKSLQQYGQWPWPRYRVALLMAKLKNMGARSIACDILFTEPDNTSLEVLRSQIQHDLGVDFTFTKLPEGLENNDAILANVLKGGPFVLGMDMLFAPQTNEQKNPLLVASHEVTITQLSTPDAPPLLEALHTAKGILYPLEPLAQKSAATGFVTVAADEDGILRRVPLFMAYQGKVYPSLAIAALKQATGVKEILVKLSSLGTESIRLGPIEIPVDHKGQMAVNYRGPAKMFSYYSAADIISGDLAPSAVANKIVFIGTSASGLRDIRPTPLDTSYPGVEVHATIVDNILSKQFIVTPSWSPAVILCALFLTALFTSFLVAKAKGILIPFPLVGLAIGLWLGTGYLFRTKGIYISPLYPYLTLATTFTLLVVIKFWREEREKRFIQGAFSHYLAPAVVRKIVDNPNSLSLDGEEKEVTIQFSDIRSFTSISEQLTPSQVTELLHDYMTPMTEIIAAHSGTLDKFIGDAIMAFWNAPLNVPNHQEQALAAALTQLERLKKLNKNFTERFGSPLHIGIGLHAGIVRVGNMGSAKLFDYTIIGDTVNLASRLEGLCKYYGQEIIVSQAIVDACPAQYIFQELDQVKVKGKDETVTIYTVLKKEAAQERQEELKEYARALELYRNGNFEKAAEAFKILSKTKSAHILYALYEKRCQTLMQNPPQNWDGVFAHTAK